MSCTARVYFAAALWAVASIPTAHAYCYFDDDNYEHCTLSTGVRIAIGVAIAVAGILLILSLGMMRRRRMQRQNLAYINPGNMGPSGYPAGGGPYGNNGYQPNPQSGYYPGYGSPGQGQGQWQEAAPQYPPPTHTGYDAQSGYAPPFQQPPKYTPPAGNPPPLGGKDGA